MSTDQDLLQQAIVGVLGSVGLANLRTSIARSFRTRLIKVPVTDVGTAGNAVGERIVFTADVPCQLISASLSMGVAVVGGDTNYFEARISKRPASAPGTPVIAATVYSTATTPTPAMTPTTTVAFTPTPIPLSATGAYQQMVAGDVLTFQKLVTASGLALGAAATAAGAFASLELVIQEL